MDKKKLTAGAFITLTILASGYFILNEDVEKAYYCESKNIMGLCDKISSGAGTRCYFNETYKICKEGWKKFEFKESLTISLISCVVDYPIIYAIDNGYPVPNNLNIEIGRTNKSDIFKVGIVEYAELNKDGEYSIIQTHDLCGKSIGLFVLKGSKLKVKDLEGKTIAFGQDTPIDQAILKDVLENIYGLNTTNINFWLEYPNSALMNGRADAGLIVLPSYADAIKNENLSLLLDVSEDYKKWYGYYPIREVLVMKNDIDPDVAEDAINFLVGAYNFAYNRKGDMIQTYYSEKEYNYSNFFNFASNDKNSYLSLNKTEALQKTFDTAERQKKIKSNPEIDKFVLEVK